jgi:hypothetical protein
LQCGSVGSGNPDIITIAGTVVTIYPDAEQTKTFSIISGNTSGAFTINSSTGMLKDATASALNCYSVMKINCRTMNMGLKPSSYRFSILRMYQK